MTKHVRECVRLDHFVMARIDHDAEFANIRTILDRRDLRKEISCDDFSKGV
jgi:hypothetical protein